MNTRPELKKVKKVNEILDLGGNRFLVNPRYKVYINFPFKSGEQVFTRDLYSDRLVNILHTKKDNWYAVFYSLELNLYIEYKLQFLERIKL